MTTITRRYRDVLCVFAGYGIMAFAQDVLGWFA